MKELGRKVQKYILGAVQRFTILKINRICNVQKACVVIMGTFLFSAFSPLKELLCLLMKKERSDWLQPWCWSAPTDGASWWANLSREVSSPQKTLQSFSQPLNWLVSLTPSLPVFPLPQFPVTFLPPSHLQLQHCSSLCWRRVFLTDYERAIHLSRTVDITNAELLQAASQDNFLLAEFFSFVHEKAHCVTAAVACV